MTDNAKIDKLNKERKVLLFSYELATEDLDNQYLKKIQAIDNKLFELQRIGFRLPKKK